MVMYRKRLETRETDGTLTVEINTYIITGANLYVWTVYYISMCIVRTHLCV